MGNSYKKYKKSEENETGEDFYLEDWEIYNDHNKNLDNSVKFSNDLLISKVEKNPFNNYTVIKELGKGSYGKVLLVSHKITGAIRAMKIINKIDDGFENNDEEVLNEINILKKIDHKNIIKIFEFYIDENNYYLVTEYCKGGELFALLRKTKLTEIQVAYIMFQLFSAINYCHKMKIIHRDLKPENILITKNNKGFIRIKICDFGTSQIFQKGEVQYSIVGSLLYLAPEIFEKKYNFKCDLWSCGVIMYLLLTTRFPFFGDNNKDKIDSILYKEYNTKYLEKFSENTKDLLRKLLEKAISHKFFDEFKVKDLLTEIKDANLIDRMIENLKNYKRKSILQELAIAYLIHNFPDLEEYAIACYFFDKIDVNNNGKISLDDLYVGLSIIKGDKIKDTDVLEIFANLDIDKNNYLSYEDFVRGAIDKNCLLDEKILSFAFKYFDKDDKGVITINEISYIFKDHLTSKYINEGLKKIISEVDEDNDGKITYNEFCKLMRSLII